MHRRAIAWTLAVGLAVGVSAVVVAKPPPKTVTIKACQKKKAPVAFPHDTHVTKNKIECKTCHHKDKDPKKAATGCSAAKCHAGKAEGSRPGCEEMSPSTNPFHIRCISCHKEKGKGPKTCAECHKS